jgi:mRNA-degrading endonuclease RelE of RelBE toxin-antitoxin system
MRFRVELSRDAQKQLSQFPRDVRERIEHAIDEFEERDDSQWSNIKALQGTDWKGRLRKKVGPYRIIFRNFQSAERWKFPRSSSDPKTRINSLSSCHPLCAFPGRASPGLLTTSAPVVGSSRR